MSWFKERKLRKLEAKRDALLKLKAEGGETERNLVEGGKKFRREFADAGFIPIGTGYRNLSAKMGYFYAVAPDKRIVEVEFNNKLAVTDIRHIK